MALQGIYAEKLTPHAGAIARRVVPLEPAALAPGFVGVS